MTLFTSPGFPHAGFVAQYAGVCIVGMPAIRETLSSQGADPFINDPAQFARLIATDKGRFDALIKKANIKFGN